MLLEKNYKILSAWKKPEVDDYENRNSDYIFVKKFRVYKNMYNIQGDRDLVFQRVLVFQVLTSAWQKNNAHQGNPGWALLLCGIKFYLSISFTRFCTAE